MKKKSGDETAKDFIDRLHSDPNYRQRIAEHEANIILRREQFRAAEAPIVNALRGIGEDISSTAELVNTSRSYPAAIPVLVEHLQRPYPPYVLESIVRALTVKEARGVASSALISLFQRLPITGWPKWEVGNAICMTATELDLDALLRIVMERSHGTDREGVVLAFERLHTPQTDRVMIELLSDPTVARQAAFVAGKRMLPGALTLLEDLSKSSDKLTAKVAKKAIQRIERNR